MALCILFRYNKVTNDLAKIYSTAKVPMYGNPNKLIGLEPDITLIMRESRDPDELEHYWTEWRKATGNKMRDLYLEYITLTNEAARVNGYKDGTEMKTNSYESDTFVDEMAETWRGLKPLYEQLHAYMRDKLVKRCRVIG